jgi:Holliday junction resolvase YEN1
MQYLASKGAQVSTQAPGEAEAELAYLNRWGSIDAIYTKDGDALAFGATTVLRR